MMQRRMNENKTTTARANEESGKTLLHTYSHTHTLTKFKWWIMGFYSFALSRVRESNERPIFRSLCFSASFNAVLEFVDSFSCFFFLFYFSLLVFFFGVLCGMWYMLMIWQWDVMCVCGETASQVKNKIHYETKHHVYLGSGVDFFIFVRRWFFCYFTYLIVLP